MVAWMKGRLSESSSYAAMVAWMKGRLSEPSSYAAMGAAVMGVGVLIDEPMVIIIGIAGGIIGFALKERGVI
jgi:hypothetical protein